MLRRAFTLVELLVAVAIMGFITSMMVVALNSVSADAKRTRAIGEVTRLSEMISMLYDEESSRAVAIAPTSVTDHSIHVGVEAALLKLAIVRDLLRYSLPDRRSDLLTDPAPIFVPLRHDQDGLGNYLAQLPSPISASAVSRNLKRSQYLTRLRALLSIPLAITDPGFTAAVNAKWSSENESSECLYLILSIHSIDGTPLMENVRGKDVRDTDGDGVPEILDPWENPVAWIRWPVGFWLTYEMRDLTDEQARFDALTARANSFGDDNVDFMRSDWGYWTTNGYPITNPGGGPDLNLKPYDVKPIVLSAGPDGAFDLLLDPPYLDVSAGGYRAMGWPASAVGPRLNNPPVNSSYSAYVPAGTSAGYPDPFVRTKVTATQFTNRYIPTSFDKFLIADKNGLLGEFNDLPPWTAGTGDSEDNSVDNIVSPSF
jgi:prepilin-type N-terminal cleavage/methylation domain-containing protein